MAFSSTITQRPIAVGSRRECWGTFECDGDSGGDIATGLHVVEVFIPYPTTGTGPAAQITVNETLPLVDTDVTIACGEDMDGYWYAKGY
uniref:Uncharacterized protein n=1 Tax=viral metagenome TaxID=1070528 RepID=A0A6H1ZXJ9_9ZZZZ